MTSRRFAVRAALLALPVIATVATSSPARAQMIGVDSASVARLLPAATDSARRPPLFTQRELRAAVVAAMLTVAVSPLDHPVASELQTPHWQDNELLHSSAGALSFAGGPGPFLVGAGFFVAGTVAGAPAMTAAGIHVTEAVVLAAAIDGVGKGMAGRALPGVRTSDSFSWGRGFHDNNGDFVAFPSGHTAAAFAMAAALTGEADECHLGFDRYVGPLAYSAAGAVALSRLYEHVHWVSDLPLAVAIGSWSGLTVEGRAHWNSDRSTAKSIVASTILQRAPDGATQLGWTVPLTLKAP